MRKEIFTLAAVIVGLPLFNPSFGQAVKEPNFQSPNASSLGKFGDTPVSYHTGVPEISIPIFTVQEGNLSVPISLNYHSNGVKVDEVASFVGLGWSLTAGGSISRTIVGGPDEGKSGTSGINSSCGFKGWYKDYGLPSCLNLNSTDCPNVDYAPGPVDPGSGRGSNLQYTCYNIYMAAANGTIDTEPDIYQYNVPGHSGKFLFDANRKAHMIPEEDVFIKPEETPVLFNTWKIIGTDGTKYFFGGSSATENSYTAQGRALSPFPDNQTSTTWYLTRMESENGQHWINFEYEVEQSSYCTKATQTYIRSYNGQSGSYTIANDYTITGTDGRRLSRITTSSQHTTVDFLESAAARTDLSGYSNGESTNTSAKSLNKIEIRYGSYCKSFTLNTDYFQYTGPTTYGTSTAYAFESKRLKLNSVQEATCDNTTILPAHQFTYEESMQLPRRGSFSEDHWGYYNGKSNTARLPPFTDPVNGQQRPGADRTPDINFMKMGILKRIDYPTGGFTNFNYEAHKETPGSTTVIGGLRIASIVDNDGLGNSVTKNFNYVQGTLYAGPVSYAQYPYQNPNLPLAVQGGINIYDFGVIFSSAPNPAMQNTQGYHIGYSIVEVSSPGNGKSTYRYYNTLPTFPSMISYPRTPTVSVVGTGVLSSEEHYKEGGGLLKSIFYSYGTTGGNVVISAKKVLAALPWGAGSPYPGYAYPMWNNYNIDTYRNRLIQKIEVADGITTTTNYTYDAAYNSPKSAQHMDSKGIANRTEYTYPSDAGTLAPASMYDATNANFKNMLNVPVEQRTLVNSVLKGKTVNQFTQSGSNLWLTSQKVYPTGTSEFVEEQYQYDNNSNITAIVASGGVNKSFLWGYNNKYRIASVENAVYVVSGTRSNLVHTSFEENGTTISTAHSGTKVWNGVYSLIMPHINGMYDISYWKKPNTGSSPWVLIEQTVNITSPTTANLSIGQSGYYIDDVRLYPQGALMTTYTYTPGLGITSSSDPNHIMSFYEYDTLGRLKTIKGDKQNIVKTYQYRYKGQN